MCTGPSLARLRRAAALIRGLVYTENMWHVMGGRRLRQAHAHTLGDALGLRDSESQVRQLRRQLVERCLP